MRIRRTDEQIQQILNNIVKLKVAGHSDPEIQHELGIELHNYRRYREKLRDQWINERFAERDDFLIEHIKLAEEGLQSDRKVFQEIMNNDKCSPTARVLAAKADAEIQLYMVRLRHEGKIYADSIMHELRPGVPNTRVIPVVTPVVEP